MTELSPQFTLLVVLALRIVSKLSAIPNASATRRIGVPAALCLPPRA
ncbi:hypothetical protein [Pseudomonas putida]